MISKVGEHDLSWRGLHLILSLASKPRFTLGTGPGELWVHMKILLGVTTTVRRNRPSAEVEASQGSASLIEGTRVASRPTAPATSATPVQLT
jgi:hypothetical protein